MSNRIDQEIDTVHTVDEARFNQMIFRFFGMLLLYPDEERFELLIALAKELLEASKSWPAGGFTEPMTRLLAELSAFDEDDYSAVLNEYNRLFLVKPAAPPYASFYLDPVGYNRPGIVLQLETAYGKAGLVKSSRIKDQPDHAAVEMEFVSHLFAVEVSASGEGAEDERIEADNRQRMFLSRHLGMWIPLFAKRVREVGPKSPYGSLIDALESYVQWVLTTPSEQAVQPPPVAPN